MSLGAMLADRVVVVVRAPHLADAGALVGALVAGGIRTVELTFTVPDVLHHLREARAVASDLGAVVGVGTVLTADDAEAAVEAGAGFLVTPGLRPEVTAVARACSVALLPGALTPTEVMAAHDTGADAVKVFPASAFGPGYLRDLAGPLPHVRLVPSGGVHAANAADYLDAGAAAVTAGTAVVAPTVLAAGDWAEVTRRAAAFVTAISGRPPAAPAPA